MRITESLRALGVLGLLAGLGACSPTYQNHGYIPPEDELEQIVVGIDTRATVEETVGSPSSAGVLRESGYFYVRSRMRTVGFLEPQEIDRQVLAISFDEAGVVTNIERYGLEDGLVVPIARRTTDTGVRDTTFVQQLLRNIGRFDPAQALQPNR